jgi:hypothetical protein
MPRPPRLFLVFLFSWSLSWAISPPSWAEDEKVETPLLAGHSAHGEVFNEGPRQRAYLLEGMGNVEFPATTSSQEAQAFINQGVAQLHGFWYFESERSFRQAAALDPSCATAYWGMAMSNLGNEKRAKGFIAEAMSRKEAASEREQKYIDALHAYLEAGKDKKQERAEAYTSALEKSCTTIRRIWKRRRFWPFSYGTTDPPG